ncbi:aminoglycoside 6-adenylyltransferase [Paenibacillus athensensis]|uniref:Aminoglycoside adenylyltransferase n=1 Tax=Paenibacillus athensensis TaxID=1967502 RepID=A0A4Y8Q735_9BACL|nr:aminoglycoside 6-adenylyltransferase [Paenibacillus athensensis]MCD1257400.1 aminoglycoside 6-adenylyltransferase [Paenibacillus athensensis]
MRTEREMLDVILGTAQADERIRAVMMNGSRVNPHVPADWLRDYDIVYFVTEIEAMKQIRSWIEVFGKPIIMQTPDEGALFNSTRPAFAFLMLFQDGNRLDLTLFPLERMSEWQPDSLSKLLLDKDGRFEPLPAPSDRDYLTRPPSAAEFTDCCNEFWWVCTYTAKALWREELVYAKYTLDVPIRRMLTLMLQWQLGAASGFTCNPGKEGRFFRNLLAPARWEMLMRTYSDAQPEAIWKSLLIMGELFREVAAEVAAWIGCRYDTGQDAQVTDYLQRMRHLPKDATQL